MNNSPSVTKRARDGAKWLDQKHPGWANEINLDTLDVRRWSFCILGQIGLAKDDMPHGERLFKLGFLCGFAMEGLDCDCDDLQEAWVSIVADRHNVA